MPLSTRPVFCRLPSALSSAIHPILDHTLGCPPSPWLSTALPVIGYSINRQPCPQLSAPLPATSRGILLVLFHPLSILSPATPEAACPILGFRPSAPSLATDCYQSDGGTPSYVIRPALGHAGGPSSPSFNARRLSHPWPHQRLFSLSLVAKSLPTPWPGSVL